MNDTGIPVTTIALLTERERLAIELAVAQWARSERTASAAVERLLALGVPTAEIERHRRADATDDRLARLLRYAVTLLLTHGRLDRTDLARVRPRAGDALLAETAAVTARAFLRIAVVESLDLPLAVPPLAMAIGDY